MRALTLRAVSSKSGDSFAGPGSLTTWGQSCSPSYNAIPQPSGLASPDLSAIASERSEGLMSVIQGAMDCGVVATIPNILHISVPPPAGHPRPPCLQNTPPALRCNCEHPWCLTPTVFTIEDDSLQRTRLFANREPAIATTTMEMTQPINNPEN